MGDAAHWDERYRSVGSTAVSWFESAPTVSLELLDALGVTAADSVIDVGGGASALVDALVARGHTDVTVLDVSQVALDEVGQRLDPSLGVALLCSDLRSWEPDRTWDVWHDRAVAHFLVDDADRDRYQARLRRAIPVGGAVVVGGFAIGGPTHCSGLPVRQQSTEDLVALVGPCDVVVERQHVHVTPSGGEQPFAWIAGRLR